MSSRIQYQYRTFLSISSQFNPFLCSTTLPRCLPRNRKIDTMWMSSVFILIVERENFHSLPWTIIKENLWGLKSSEEILSIQKFTLKNNLFLIDFLVCSCALPISVNIFVPFSNGATWKFVEILLRGELEEISRLKSRIQIRRRRQKLFAAFESTHLKGIIQ